MEKKSKLISRVASLFIFLGVIGILGAGCQYTLFNSMDFGTKYEQSTESKKIALSLKNARDQINTQILQLVPLSLLLLVIGVGLRKRKENARKLSIGACAIGAVNCIYQYFQLDSYGIKRTHLAFGSNDFKTNYDFTAIGLPLILLLLIYIIKRFCSEDIKEEFQNT